MVITDFLFEVMCCFGCIFQLTCDNGTEFKGTVEELMRKYNVLVVRISPYNSQVNGEIEWMQHMYIEALWMVLQGETAQWPSWLGFTLRAASITITSNPGVSRHDQSSSD